MTAQSEPSASNAKKTRPKRKRGRRLLIALALLAIVLIVGVVLAPTIAGAVAPGIVAGKASESIAGRVEVDSVSVSWMGTQKAKGIRVYDAEGVLVAEFDVSAGAGLLALATGSRDLGEIELSGVVRTDRDDAGSVRLMNAIAPSGASATSGGAGRAASPGAPGGPKGSPPSLPASLAAKLNITQLRVEEGVEVLATLTGGASIAPGEPIKINLKPAFGGGGAGVIDATVTSLIDSAGAINIDNASVDLTIKLEAVPTALVQALNPSDTDLGELLGESFAFTASALGTIETMDATLSIKSAGVNGALGVNIRDGIATRTGETQVLISGERAARAIPALRSALSESASIEFETWPDATLIVSQLSVPIDAVRSGTFEEVLVELRLKTTPARARVPLSGADGRTGVLALSETVLYAAATDLSEGVSLAGVASATLDGRDAGQITIQNLRTGPLFDADGALLDPMSIGITGEMNITGLAAETIQPFADALGVDVAQEIGPVINTSLKAARESGSNALSLILSVDGEKVEASSHVLIEGSTIRAAPGAKALSVTLTDPSSTLNRVLADSNVMIDRASPVSIVIDTFEANLEDILGDTLDLRSVRAQGALRVPAVVGRLTREGETTELTISGVQIKFDAPESLASVSASGLMQVGVGGQAPAAITLALEADDLLGSDGSIDVWGATAQASLKAPGVPAAAIDVFMPENTIVAREDLGPTVSIDASVHKASGRESAAIVDLQLSSERVTLSAALSVDETRLQTRENGVELRSLGLAGLIERFAPMPEGMRVSPKATGVVRVRSLDVPMSGWSPAFDDAVFEGGVRITRLGVRSSLGTNPRANSRPIELALSRAAGEAVKLLVTTEGVIIKGMSLGADPATGAARVAPPSELDYRIEASAPWEAMVAGEADVTLSMTGTLSDEGGQKLATLAGGGTVSAPSLQRVNINITAELSSSARTQDALALGDLLTGLFGQSASVRASLASESFDPKDALAGARIGLEVNSPRMKTTSPVRLVGDEDSLRLEQASGLSWRVDEQWATRRLAGGREPTLRVSRPVDLELDLQRLVVPRRESGRLDVQIGATSSDIAITLRDGVEVEYQGLVATARSTETPGVLAINATMKNKGGASNALLADLTVAGLGSAAQTPALSGKVIVTALPSTVADALVGGNGKLAMLLGESADMRIFLTDFPRNGGTAKGSVKGINASATFDGRVENGMFIASKPAVLNVQRIDSEFGFELAKIIPVFGGIEKDPNTHAPGTVIIRPLRVPVDGRDVLEFASATIRIDPGEANLQLDGGLGGFLNLGGQGQTIGRRLEPFNVRFERGVASYSNVVVPIGEFELVARGNVNLIQQTQDVRVALPIGALAAEVAPGGGGIGAILDATGGVSLANKGKIGQSSWKLKLGGGGGKSPDPASILEGILGGLGGNNKSDKP